MVADALAVRRCHHIRFVYESAGGRAGRYPLPKSLTTLVSVQIRAFNLKIVVAEGGRLLDGCTLYDRMRLVGCLTDCLSFSPCLRVSGPADVLLCPEIGAMHRLRVAAKLSIIADGNAEDLPLAQLVLSGAGFCAGE